jgi:preprotein translocase subunit SecG
MDFLIGIGIVALVLLSLFIVLIVLMQRPSANAGMGSSLGGGAAEQAFGAETGNILTRATIWGTIGFFVLAFSLYLGTQKKIKSEANAQNEVIPEEATPPTPTPETVTSPPATSTTSATAGTSPSGN